MMVVVLGVWTGLYKRSKWLGRLARLKNGQLRLMTDRGPSVHRHNRLTLDLVQRYSCFFKFRFKQDIFKFRG